MSERPEIESERLVRDPALQRGHWRVERIVWILIAATLLSAALGLLGPGPLSGASRVGADGALRVTYQRLVHAGSSHEVRVETRPAPGSADVALAISSRYLDRMRLQSVSPQPRLVESSGAEQVYHFASTGSPMVARFVFDASSPGRAAAVLRSGGAEVRLSQFVFP